MMNVRKTLIELGTPPVVVPVALQYLYFLPETSDPDSAGVIAVIQALQKGLRRLGHQIAVNGIFDAATVQAIDAISPPEGSWRVKTWIQILGDVVTAIQNPRARRAQLKAMSGYQSQGGIIDTLTSIGSGAAFLKWGYGASNKSNCAAADAATKSVFKSLQRQANRLLPIYGGSPVVEDGVIGTGTVGAMQKLSSVIGIYPMECTPIANNAILFATKIKIAADGRGIAADANTVAGSSGVRPQGPIVKSDEQLTDEKKKILGIPKGVFDEVLRYLPFAVGAAGLAWFLARKRKTA